jgi:hypothetical protein
MAVSLCKFGASVDCCAILMFDQQYCRQGWLTDPTPTQSYCSGGQKFSCGESWILLPSTNGTWTTHTIDFEIVSADVGYCGFVDPIGKAGD